MSQIRNRIVLIGRVGHEPEIKCFDSGKKRAQFSLAVTESYYDDKGDRVENTQWHRIAAWGKTADFMEKFVHKGLELAVDGKLSNRNYEDSDGNKRYITEVLASEVLLIGGAKKEAVKQTQK